MHLRLIYLLLLSFAASLGQQRSVPLTIRSIQVKLVATSPEPAAPIGFHTIANALKSRGVNLAVEDRFDPTQLKKARDVIRDLYSASARQVRVDHSVMNMSTRGIEIAFEVVELCNGK